MKTGGGMSRGRSAGMSHPAEATPGPLGRGLGGMGCVLFTVKRKP